MLTCFADIATNIYLVTNDGKNCLHIAAQYGHLSLCKALIDKHRFDVYMVDCDGWAALHFSVGYGSYNLYTYFANIKVDINFRANNEINCLHIAALCGHLRLCTTLIQRYRFDIHMADNDGWTAFHFSARNGSYELVKFFVDMGAAIDLQTNDRKNCLHITTLYGHLNLIKTFINEHEFDIHMTDNDGWRPIHFSAKNGSYELITYFVDMGTNVNIKTNYGKNCLHIAALSGHFNLCKKLLDEHNFDVHDTDNEGWTALHFSVRHGCDKLVTYFAKMGIDIGRNSRHVATIYGHLHLCKTLINKHNFDVHMADNDGWTALHFSAKSGSPELLRIFADMGSDIKLQTKDGKNCLHIAAVCGHLNICKILTDEYNFDIHRTDNEGWGVIHFSAANGSYKLLKYFANMGSNIHLETNDGKNSLHIASWNGHFNLCKILINKHNFNVNITDNGGWKALHFSVKSGSYNLFTYLASLETDVTIKTNDGKNCLHISALYGYMSLCKNLIDRHNFDIHAANNDGWRAIHFSARNGSYKLVKYFVDMGANIDLETNNGKNCLHIAALYGHLKLCKKFIDKHKINVYMTDKQGWNALHFSTRNGSDELFSYFAVMGIGIGTKNKDGWNCRHIAVMHGHLNLCKTLIYKYNFDLHWVDNDGWTALHFSTKKGSRKLITFFSNMGVDVKLRTNDGKNCLHIAALYGHLKLCKTLKNKHEFDVYLVDNGG